MGQIVSTLFGLNYKSSKLEKEKPTDSQKPNVKLTTKEASEDAVEKYKTNGDSKICKSISFKTKLLKSLKADPRSPTVGIYRTPILVEDTPSSKNKSNSFDTPVSIYSCNISDSTIQDIVTPVEPSVNVSGFEDAKDDFDCTLEPENIIAEERKNKSLKVSDMPNTYEAKRLLDEILSEEENFIKKVPLKREKKPEIKLDKKKELRGKSRPPLSNITSSANSPSHINIGGKCVSRNKVFVEESCEKFNHPSTKHLAQWDQNHTVFI